MPLPQCAATKALFVPPRGSPSATGDGVGVEALDDTCSRYSHKGEDEGTRDVRVSSSVGQDPKHSPPTGFPTLVWHHASAFTIRKMDAATLEDIRSELFADDVDLPDLAVAANCARVPPKRAADMTRKADPSLESISRQGQLRRRTSTLSRVATWLPPRPYCPT